MFYLVNQFIKNCDLLIYLFIFLAGQFNLAIKMLFNYGIQSNAEALKKAMDKELLPLDKCFYHPNIVRMYSCFVDSFPLLNDAHEYYPMAIPTRLSSDSFGRNKTLFIVMKKYDLTLNEYIQLNQPTKYERLLLFAQLIEALLYLNNHSIVHRDLKSDNLLICNATGELVLADFGCALYHPPDLKLPYQTDEICKGGNIALMAPEVN
jgi:serine/threonine protein kinase